MGGAFREIGVAALQTLYLFAPLLVSAALSGVVLRYDLVRVLRRPIDGGLTLRGRRVFGESKTWRGIAVAVVGSIATLFAQGALREQAPSWLQVCDYAAADPLAMGFAMGLGAMVGELPNSFVKRQLGIAPGRTTSGGLAIVFYVWDQVDLLTGAWPLILPWVRPSPTLLATSFGIALSVHPLVALIGYAIGARKSAR